MPLRQFLDCEIDLLNANIVAIDQSDDYVSLTLQDDTPAGTVRVALVFDKESKDLRQWVLRARRGRAHLLALRRRKGRRDSAHSTFYVDPNLQPSTRRADSRLYSAADLAA